MQVGMHLSFWNVFFLIAFLVVFVSVFSMASFALGAFCVFRTKREAHEPFLSVRTPRGDAGISQSEFDEREDKEMSETTDRVYGRLSSLFGKKDMGYLSDPGVDEEVYPDEQGGMR